MDKTEVVHKTPVITEVRQSEILSMLNAFFTAKEARWKEKTTWFYQDELGLFLRFLDTLAITELSQLTPDVIRRYLADLAKGRVPKNRNPGKGRKPGGVHGAYRAVKSFVNWTWLEYEPTWKNPIDKVEPPKINQEPLPGISNNDIWAMLETCGNGRLDIRDRAMLLVLFDTGIRASELKDLNICDADLNDMWLVIWHGKGDKFRAAPFQDITKQAIRRYLKTRKDAGPEAPLFVSDESTRLTYWGVRQIIRRRAQAAGIEPPGLHDFRRAAGREMNNNGMGIFDIGKILGHSNPKVTMRYIQLDQKNLGQKFAAASPVENSRPKRKR